MLLYTLSRSAGAQVILLDKIKLSFIFLAKYRAVFNLFLILQNLDLLIYLKNDYIYLISAKFSKYASFLIKYRPGFIVFLNLRVSYIFWCIKK